MPGAQLAKEITYTRALVSRRAHCKICIKSVPFCELCEEFSTCSSQNAPRAAPMHNSNACMGPPHSQKTHHGTKGRTARLGRPLERQGRVLRSTAYATSRRPEAAAGRRVQRAVDGLARREAGQLVVPR